MIRLKGCPKCSGDMHYDPLVEEYVCLQCGLAVDKLPSEQTEPMRPSLAALRRAWPDCLYPPNVAGWTPVRADRLWAGAKRAGRRGATPARAASPGASPNQQAPPTSSGASRLPLAVHGPRINCGRVPGLLQVPRRAASPPLIWTRPARPLSLRLSERNPRPKLAGWDSSGLGRSPRGGWEGSNK
jgi:hypothetical protein